MVQLSNFCLVETAFRELIFCLALIKFDSDGRNYKTCQRLPVTVHFVDPSWSIGGPWSYGRGHQALGCHCSAGTQRLSE